MTKTNEKLAVAAKTPSKRGRKPMPVDFKMGAIHFKTLPKVVDFVAKRHIKEGCDEAAIRNALYQRFFQISKRVSGTINLNEYLNLPVRTNKKSVDVA